MDFCDLVLVDTVALLGCLDFIRYIDKGQ